MFADVAQLHARKQSLQGMTSVSPRAQEPAGRVQLRAHTTEDLRDVGKHALEQRGKGP